MPVSVAEYLGQRTDVAQPIVPVTPGDNPNCPFMAAPCTKVSQGYKPVCSVRNTDGTVWIVCRNRLCASRKTIELSEYQRKVLYEVAVTVFGDHVQPEQIIVKREVPMATGSGTNYSADYVMVLHDAVPRGNASSQVVLEMQGGGETSNTGKLTRHTDVWENAENRTNAFLAQPVSGVGTIVTNAWRRQQEQFLVKGNIATNTGASIVFCVGSLLFDELHSKIERANLQDLRDHNWTLALVGFSEDEDVTAQPGPIPFKVDPNRLLFTNYHSFIRALTDQGIPDPQIFTGRYVSLGGTLLDIGGQQRDLLGE